MQSVLEEEYLEEYHEEYPGGKVHEEVGQYAECVGWPICGTHHLNGCLGATWVAYTKIPRLNLNFKMKNSTQTCV